MLNFIIKTNDLFTKLSILSQAAKYDKICTGTGKEFKTDKSFLNGIYYTYLSNGKCMPLLKILYTNICKNDCKYCYNRRANDIKRTIFSPEEIAKLSVELYKKGYIKGLFLSSGIYHSSDDTMELMIKAIEILRKIYDFKGYIHLKILPGTSEELIKKAVILANRVSCNIELPTQKSLKFLAPEKDKNELIKTLALIKKAKLEIEKPVSSSTQLIIGATPDNDKTILNLAKSLYKNKLVKRIYYSAYIPVNNDPELPKIDKSPYRREHRLYQADWLIRFYGFSLDEIFSDKENLDLEIDPKLKWALSHPEFFPVDLAKSDYWELIRVPGIGIKTAKKIIEIRKTSEINEGVLKKLGIPLKKAMYFIIIKGKPLKRPSSFKINQLTFNFSSEKKSVQLF
ncbi:putative DNA modification/repair radical SAM protein [Thermodesulfobacterium hydrogeniphilum]|uniref:putative DNA modification/repair radical SAM protein n=1 Tax=Thermodesulfobacterium hydrogeniphilum TaxID=161156 RepID=UPI000571D43B|nr:putative DNA modification/repair radical SAM protein [Thermodesulfobacterium hydrogeniphilum]